MRTGACPATRAALFSVLKPLEIIHEPVAEPDLSLPVARVPVDRLTLAKRRWRGVAEDGREFGFDLDWPLTDGATVFQDESRFVIAQKYEPVLEVRIAVEAARLGWMIGNLHFQIQITDEVVRVADDPALRLLFERERIAFVACARVFLPLGGSAPHGHHHH